jgi:hypothetical protein
MNSDSINEMLHEIKDTFLMPFSELDVSCLNKAISIFRKVYKELYSLHLLNNDEDYNFKSTFMIIVRHLKYAYSEFNPNLQECTMNNESVSEFKPNMKDLAVAITLLLTMRNKALHSRPHIKSEVQRINEASVTILRHIAYKYPELQKTLGNKDFF